MHHHRTLAVLVATTLSLAPFAHASTVDPGQSPAVMLMRNGLTGSGNELAKPPVIAITAGDMPVKLTVTSVADVVAKFGGEAMTAGEEGGPFTYVCYATPAAGDVPAMLTWFLADDPDSAGKLTHVAVELAPAETPAACVAAKSSVTLKTGAPLPGATQADLDKVFGAGADKDDDGTVGWFFGGTKDGQGGVVNRTELKYRVIDGKAVAAEVGSFFEME